MLIENNADDAEWQKQLAEAFDAASDKNVATYFQLATLCPDKGPQVRTVVFRGLTKLSCGGQGILIATDARSNKMREIEANPKAQIGWYFTDRRMQFRFSGDLLVYGATAERETKEESPRQKVWQGMSKNARKAFFANTMGDVETVDNELLKRDEVPETFVALAMLVTTVDILDIASKPHRRWLHSLTDGEWCRARTAL